MTDMETNEKFSRLYSDRVALFEGPEGVRYVAYGDGKTLPYRSFLQEEIFSRVRQYLVSPNSNVTALDSRQLAGYLGAALARQSRTPGTVADVLAKEFLDEKGVPNYGKLDALIERILIQYGDDSVQELECATVLFNGISNLATKKIQDRRLASYIEQSSRYVLYTERDKSTGDWFYYREPKIMASSLRERYIAVMDRCFDTYTKLCDALTARYEQMKPLEEAEYAVRANDKTKLRFSDLKDDAERIEFKRVWKFDLRSRACDTARIVLPAATLTNMAMVANGRTYEYLLKILYSSDEPEFIDIATRLHSTLHAIIPKYVKRAYPAGDPFLRSIEKAASDIAARAGLNAVDEPATEEVRVLETPELIANTPEARAHLLASVVFPHARVSYDTLAQTFAKGTSAELDALLLEAAGKERRNRFDRSPRGFEHGYPITVEVVGNFGIFRDLHRHRMMTLLRQRLTPHLGFTVPADVESVGFGDEVRAIHAEVTALYDALRKEVGEHSAEYVVLFGHHIRFVMGMNIRESQHLLEIRTIAQGHPDYRRICQKIAQELARRAPYLVASGLHKFVDYNEYPWSRADAEARQSQKAAERGISTFKE